MVNFGFYKDVIAQGDFRLQFSALLDNAFNHPQFFPTYGSGFVDLTSFLIDGDPANGDNGRVRGRGYRKRGRILARTSRAPRNQGRVLKKGRRRKDEERSLRPSSFFLA